MELMGLKYLRKSIAKLEKSTIGVFLCRGFASKKGEELPFSTSDS
jgi:hypothetical protein